jgi:hypothetical protein
MLLSGLSRRQAQVYSHTWYRYGWGPNAFTFSLVFHFDFCLCVTPASVVFGLCARSLLRYYTKCNILLSATPKQGKTLAMNSLYTVLYVSCIAPNRFGSV